MKTPCRLLLAAALLSVSLVLAPRAQDGGRRQTPNQTAGRSGQWQGAPGTATAEFVRAESAYRANNLGVALLEQFKHREGAEQFRRALEIAPGLTLARVNLAVALYNVPDITAAAEAARAALRIAPASPQANYIAGLVARQQNRAEDAVAHFRKVLEVDPRDTGANVNLGQLYAQQRNYAEAVARFRTAVEAEPYNGTALYNLGTALLRAGKREEGQRLIQRFQELRQSGAATVVGQNYLEQGRYAEAVTSTGAEAELVSPETPPVRFVDATARAFAGAGNMRRRARGNRRRAGRGRGASAAGGGGDVARPTHQANDAWKFAATLGGGVTPFDADGDGDLDLLDLSPFATRLYRNDRGQFTDVSARTGDLAKSFTGVNVGAVAGDYDNDGREDLFVLRFGAPALFRNEGGGKFSDRTTAARVGAYRDLALSAAFVDADHDGDLDLFVAGFADAGKFRLGDRGEINSAGGAPNLLLRNNGDGTFADVTREAKIAGEGRMAVAVVPTDYDNRRDVDLLVVNHQSAPTLYRNLRDTTFRDVAEEVGLGPARDFTAAAAGDVNKDEFTDFFFASRTPPGRFVMSDGRREFKLDTPADLSADGRANTPPSAERFARGAAQFLDYDNDGLLDLVTLGAEGEADGEALLRVRRNVGDGWRDVSGRALRGGPLRERVGEALSGFTPGVLASGDADGDGDTDLFLRSADGALEFLRNDGGNLHKSVGVNLAGKVSNRSGVGSKIEARAGSLQQKFEVYSASPAPAPADVTFGLGPRDSADAVRVIWPSGVVQAETESVSKEGAQTVTRVAAGTLRVTELDRKPSSCPFLYAWNGERFEFVTDFMGGGELGYYAAPGVRAAPDPDEYVRLPPGTLKEKNGRLELRVTNELEEALFIDRLQLVAVAHPAGTEVHPNEGLGNPTSSAFKLYATDNARPPHAARDERGRDLLPRVSRLDRRYADGFPLLSLRGYAAEHSLILDLGGDESASRPSAGAASKSETPSTTNSSLITHHSSLLLLLTGWTDYAFSSDNVAAAQRGLGLAPPKLQVRDREGNWRTVIENIGIPVGRPQTVAVDLTGKFLSESREVRLVTNMRIYWDQILVGTRVGARRGVPADAAAVRVERLEAAEADLGWRGFSAVSTPDGREPFGYDYARVFEASPWKILPGRYTRLGDVRELLAAVDDIFVVSRPGDEISLSFDARALRPLPAGWTRTFLLYSDGFSKEMDINSASPHELAPLPFHGMKSYPYAAPDAYPSTPRHQSYVERYNTRVVAGPLPSVIATDR